jgi:hypothetical protein
MSLGALVTNPPAATATLERPYCCYNAQYLSKEAAKWAVPQRLVLKKKKKRLSTQQSFELWLNGRLLRWLDPFG